MAYDENSTHSPLEAGADITQANVARVPNNPFDPAVGINFPAQYDAFINKTNDQMSSVNVVEERSLSEISGSTLYLQHRPRLNASVVVSDGTLDSNIDYNNGVVTFTALPAGDFTVTYLADPDKYYGEYLNTLQDAVMELQKWAGAGSTAHEGVKNANIALLSTGGNIDSRLTNATNLSALPLDTDVSIKSDTGQSNTITLGNGDDTVVVDSSNVSVTDNLTDTVKVKGKLVIAEDNGNTQASDQATHASLASTYYSAPAVDEDVAVFYGDLRVFGDITTAGSIVSNTNNVTTDVIATDLTVNGNTILGNSTADTTTVSGPLSADSLTVTGTSVFNDNITLAADKTVDGVDLKALSSELQYMRPGGPDWKADSINVTSYQTEAYSSTTGTQTIGYSSTVGFTNAGSNIVSDSSATAGAYVTTTGMNEAFDDIYTDGTWRLKFLSGNRAGEVFTVVSGPATNTNQWTLDRVCDGVGAGSSYIVYSPYRNIPNHLTGAGFTVTLNASTANPFVATVADKVHVITDSSMSLSLSASTVYNIFLRTDANGNPEIAAAELADFAYPVGSVYLGFVNVGAGGITSIRPARPNQKFDSGWVNLSAGISTLPHHIGGDMAPAEVKIMKKEGLPAGSQPTSPILSNYISDADAADAHLDAINSYYYKINVGTAGYYRIIISRF